MGTLLSKGRKPKKTNPKCSFSDKEIDELYGNIITKCKFNGDIPGNVHDEKCPYLGDDERIQNRLHTMIQGDCYTPKFQAFQGQSSSSPITLATPKKRKIVRERIEPDPIHDLVGQIRRLAGNIIREIDKQCKDYEKHSTSMTNIEKKCYFNYMVWRNFLSRMKPNQEEDIVTLVYTIPRGSSKLPREMDYHYVLDTMPELNKLYAKLNELKIELDENRKV